VFNDSCVNIEGPQMWKRTTAECYMGVVAPVLLPLLLLLLLLLQAFSAVSIMETASAKATGETHSSRALQHIAAAHSVPD
jgi:hypothetical protein